jgi:GH35 family endo-1,4-beta-xylanase
MGVSLILFVLDRTRLSDVVAIHAWGLFGADMWIRRRYKQHDTEPLVTSLKL